MSPGLGAITVLEEVEDEDEDEDESTSAHHDLLRLFLLCRLQ